MLLFLGDQFGLYLWSAYAKSRGSMLRSPLYISLTRSPLSFEGFLIVFCGSVPTLKPVYDEIIKFWTPLRHEYFGFLRGWASHSRDSDPNWIEKKARTEQHIGVHGVQQPAPVHKKTEKRSRARGLMEVGLWSSHGSKLANTTQNESADDERRASSVAEAAWRFNPDTSYLLV